ncbi:uncharacterized protein [Anoplolepis gracilipes]|uniref:uncharacterized protein isoform X1 n=1 Tax=Anoplolepis gracilipes TaxID=354296 RepID=UPI003BA210DA
MPSCFVKNCKNRTNVLFRKKVRYFSFPKDPEIRIKWLEACQKDKNYEIKSERVCEVHFSLDCFENKMTKGTVPKLKYRLKPGSVPTELLQLSSKRKKIIHIVGTDNIGNAKLSKKSVCPGIPTYAELIECTYKEIEAIPEFIECEKLNVVEDVSMESIDYTHNPEIPTYPELVECTNKETGAIPEFIECEKLNAVEDVSMEGIDYTYNPEISTYPELIEGTNKENKAIPEFIECEKLNAVEDVSMEGTDYIYKSIQNATEERSEERKPEKIEMILEDLEALKKENKELKQIINRMKKDARKKNIYEEKIAIDILHSIFTPGQVKRIVSQQNRMKWSVTDITSAIALHSVSATAYNYLREVRKIPLPSVTTLRKLDFSISD